jgi:predicted dinucleotide-binding enzyme
MNIAVFGTGIVGQVIATRLAGLGHSVTIGTRDRQKTLSRKEKDGMGNPPFPDWFEQHKHQVSLATYSDAALSSELIFNCTQGAGSVDALKMAGGKNLQGKILVDVANPLDFSKGMPPSLSPVNTDSLGELIQRTFPGLKVVKTLNTMNCFLMVNPAALPGDHNVFMCGNDQTAKEKVTELLRAFGWKDTNIIELGDITNARATEQLLPIWVRLYGSLKTAMFNFSIISTAKAT